MDITTLYQKNREDFGRPVNTFESTLYLGTPEFAELEFEHQDDERAAHIERNPTVLEIQAKPEMSENYVRARPIAPPPSPPGCRRRLRVRRCVRCGEPPSRERQRAARAVGGAAAGRGSEHTLTACLPPASAACGLRPATCSLPA